MNGVIEHVSGLTLSLIVGLLLAYSSVWVISRINDRYTQWEKNLCRVLFKRGKKEAHSMFPFSNLGDLSACSNPGGSGETKKRELPAPRYGLIHTFQATRKKPRGSRRIPPCHHTTKRGIS